MPTLNKANGHAHAQFHLRAANTTTTPSPSSSSSTSLPYLSLPPALLSPHTQYQYQRQHQYPSPHHQHGQHGQHTRPYKIIFLPGPPGTLAARHEQIALLMQRNLWAREFDLRCVFAGDAHAHAHAHTHTEAAAYENGNEVVVSSHGQAHGASDAHIHTATTASEVRRVSTLRAAVSACTTTETLDDGASGRGIGQGSQDGIGSEKGVVVLIDGFPLTKSEALLFQRLVGPPDCVVLFTGEAAFLKRALGRELRERGRKRERARSFGVPATSNATGGDSGGSVASQYGAMGDLLIFGDEKQAQRVVAVGGVQAGGKAGEVEAEQQGREEDIEAIEKEVAKRLAEGWHLPLLEISNWYTAELGPRAVAEVHVQKGKEAVYAEVIKLLGRVIRKVVD